MMSQKEYDKLIAGEIVTNTTVHDPTHEFSYSVGFCFLPWIVEYTGCDGLTDKMSAMQAIDRLIPGGGNYDLLVQLKVLNPRVLKKSLGWYLDFKTYEEVWSNELCTTSYSTKDLQPTRAFKMQKVLDVLWARSMASEE